MMRTSTFWVRVPPTMVIVFSCTKRSSFDLHFERQIANLVEKDGAAVGLREPSLGPSLGAGVRAALAAEQFRIDQRRREWRRNRR